MKKKLYKRGLTPKLQKRRRKDIILIRQNLRQSHHEKIDNELYKKMLVDQYMEFSKNDNIYLEKRLYLIIVSLVSGFLSYILGEYPLLIAISIIYTLTIIKSMVTLDFSPSIINDYDSFLEIEDKTSELLSHIGECYKKLENLLTKYIKFEIYVVSIFIMLKLKIWYLTLLIIVYLLNVM